MILCVMAPGEFLWPRRQGFAATIRSAAHPAVAADDAAPKPHPRKGTPHPGQAMGSRDACRMRLRCWLGSGTVTGYGVASRVDRPAAWSPCCPNGT